MLRALFALIVILIVPAAANAAQDSTIEVGAGRFIFEHHDGKSTRPVTIWTYRPKQLTGISPVLFVMPGVDRDGERYRNEWLAYAERGQALLLVPEFSTAHFPGGRNYSAPRPQANSSGSEEAPPFAFAALERIFDQALRVTHLTAKDYRLYGHSAGAQFAHRFILSYPEARVKIAIAANAGWYMLPEFETNFPYGLRQSGVTPEGLKRAFARKLIVLLGEKDTDPNHPQLSQSARAKQQGPNRFQRGQTFFRVAERQAQKLSVELFWELKTVPNVAHSNAGMARAAAPLLLR